MQGKKKLKSKIHFISGLPRSGSTLLAAILRQNPRFYARMSGPLGNLINQNLTVMSQGNEFSLFITPEQKQSILKGIFTNYYESIKKEVIFDTNRIWCAKLPLIKQLFPEAKVIACVRNIAWVMDSLERIVRKNPLNVSGMFNNAGEASTVYSRTEALGKSDRLVGFAYEALKEGFYSNEAESLLVLEYENLTQYPAEIMKLIYQFIGEEYYNHDFDNLDYQEEEFDARLKTPDLHTVKKKVVYQPRRTILPPDLFERYNNLSFWHDQTNSKANVISQIKN